MSTQNLEDTTEDPVLFPTPEEITSMLRGTGDQQEFTMDDDNRYHFTLHAGEDVQYLIVASIVGIVYKGAAPVYQSDEKMAEEIGLGDFYSDDEDFPLANVQSPDDVNRIMSGDSDFRIHLDPTKDGRLRVTLQHPDDPLNRELQTFAILDMVSRNNTKIYPHSAPAQPQA